MYYGPSLEELQARAAEEQLGEERKQGAIAVIAGLVGNICVGIVKFIAAAISGSAAMASEGVHSIVDSGNGVFMLLGLRNCKKEPDYLHPFGYGKELYFWTMVVALLVFFLGGGVSIIQGIDSLRETMQGTRVMGDFTLNYIVLIAAMIIEGTTLGIAIKQFNNARGDTGARKFIRDTKNPTLYTVVLEDSAAEAGLIIAFISNLLCQFTGIYYFDGAASLVIGLLLCFVAVILLRETKGLLVGEGMKHLELDELRDIVEADDRVLSCGRILTMYMGPESLLITLDATFRSTLSAQEVLKAVDDIEQRLHVRWPQATAVFIEAESLRSVLHQQVEEDQWEDEYEDEYEEEFSEEELEQMEAQEERLQELVERLDAAVEAAEAREQADQADQSAQHEPSKPTPAS